MLAGVDRTTQLCRYDNHENNSRQAFLSFFCFSPMQLDATPIQQQRFKKLSLTEKSWIRLPNLYPASNINHSGWFSSWFEV
jgi:hypothetical protein